MNYGGNSFPRSTAETHAERLPIWNYIDHSKLVGVAAIPDGTFEVGKVFVAGTPVQLGADGENPKIGTEATKPDGLLRADVIVGEGGCTLTLVRSGSIRIKLVDFKYTDEQKTALPLIEFDEEPSITIS